MYLEFVTLIFIVNLIFEKGSTTMKSTILVKWKIYPVFSSKYFFLGGGGGQNLYLIQNVLANRMIY